MIKSQFFFINNSFLELLYAIIKKPNKPKIKKKLKKVFFSENIILTNFGRTAFFFILKFLKIREPSKKEVLVSSYNFFEIINMIIYNKLIPVFYDLDKHSLNLNIKDVKKKINKNTLCIVITHFNGFDTNTFKIKKLANKKKIKLIEDCAISLNTNLNSPISKSGDFSFYSLNFTKNLSSITGGIIKTNRSNFKKLNKIIFNSNFSIFHSFKNFLALFLLKIISNKYLYNLFHLLLKFNERPIRKIFDLNYKIKVENEIPKNYLNNLSDRNFNILDYSIKKLTSQNQIRIQNNLEYFKLLKKKKTINFLIPKKNLNLITLELPILFKNINIKKKFLKNLKKNNLDYRKKYYSNCSELKIFKKYANYETLNSKNIERNIVCLPNHPLITSSLIKQYCELVK